ncbi:NBAS subunit of NRZ tethering complex isoform X3 [Anas platyrhynchos]|uniref:NBAS subunit of NRZ tethering complex n=1 Tax=Anas zonorhyncha TaxID=75864 RepID=A0A8B9ZSS3_9AVES|nr:neuroblastoma-amplified sequence isoform X3 [Anas platyrhynchos]|eukprot:XP_027311054.1 neuroblastoma-amplified sequence isoform X3 [Anas platyrhynchos]
MAAAAAAGGEGARRAAGMAAGSGAEEGGGEEENVLYDLLLNAEWPPETEVQPRGNRKHGASFIITRAITGPALFLLRYIWYSPAKFSLPNGLVRLVNKQINWQLVLASNGKLLAVVQDQCIEIRSAKDDFGSIVGKCQVPKDFNPQWRRVAWSHDCTLLAYAESTGTVRVFDLMGSELLVISPTASFPGDLSYAVAGLIFLEYKASAQWSAELLVVNYRGELRSYLVSVGTNQSFQESHSFSFSSHYAHGITTVIYHPGHRLLLVGGCETDEDGVSKATGCGISAWRVLSGSPHYKQVTSYEDDIRTAQRRGLLRIMNLRFYSRRGTEQDGIFKMNLSPDGALLAAIHFSGKLTIWSIPSLRQQGEWDQADQPGYDEINPDWSLSSEKRKKIKDKESYYPLIDVNWWADNSVILARCSGALTVSSVKTLRNLLGKSCEWFESSPQVTSAHDGGFLSLECEIKLVPKRLRLESRPGDEDEGEDDSDSDDENSAKDRYFSYLKQGLYFVTEMERFAPPRKRPRTITKNFRLVSLRSTTPEELYQRKIDNEEYGEALSLAQAYGLDSDLVYQRQWRKSAVNVASIQDYLSKIKKRAWVLHECLERVPENVDAAKKLLQYGLKGTDLEALVAIGKGEDGGRFILPGEVDIEIPYEDFLSADEETDAKKEKEARKHQELLLSVNFSKLTLEQKELCRSRLKLLIYLDRLETYEEILGGPHAAKQHYDGEFFKKFRNQNIVLSARTYARESNVRALEILFTFHGSALLPHRQAILSNFPETTSPHEYAFLLPEACYKQGTLKIVPWNEQKHREEDWCEKAECRMIVEPTLQDEGEFLYETQPELLKYRTTELSVELVTDWYLSRAQEIEKYSMQVDCALSLVRLGMERNIPGLQVLCDNLITLETVVYETDGDRTLTLKELVEMKDIEKLRLLMKNSSDEKYVKNVYQWMIPFLHRCENQSPGLANSLFKEYLVTLAKEDLTLPLKIFQSSKPACQQKIIPEQDQLMITALECIYSCERDDQLALCYDILECLPQRGYGPETDITNSLHDAVDELEQILSVSELLEKHGLQKPVSFVKDTKDNAEEARKLMIRLTRHTGRKQPSVNETQWKELLQDMLDMQQKVYTCLQSDTCYEIFTESLLCSSSIDNIHLAGQMMHCSTWSVDQPVSSKGKPQYKVSYMRSIELVLAAGREYFNSSTSLTDSCMDLARSCLQLIVDCPSDIQEELDLIRALGYLEEFGVKILPLQVRLCSDRLSLIKDCLSQLSTNYKQSAKLLGLANLLRVAGDDQMERKGQVLILLVEQALSFQDYKAASMHCQELMTAGYSKSWEVCSQLGQSEGFHDLHMRQELMAFALTHCPPNAIEALLGVSSSLQTQILYQAVNHQLLPSEGDENVNSSIPSSLISKDAEGQEFGDVLKSGPGENVTVEKQGCHPFYESLIADPYVAESESNYGTYQNNSLESFAEVLLRTEKLTETKSEGKNLLPTTEVLLQLASDALPNDMALSLAYLLALPQVVDANKCFEKQLHSALSLQLASYYYSLQIYARLAPCFKDKCHPLYRADPKELIKMVTQHVTQYGYKEWPEEIATLINHLHYYNERLLDFTQAQILQGLGKGVDVQRFTADGQYKRETILGLAETLEENVYKIAVSLAQRYNVPLWEVYMTHLEFLFTDSGLSTLEIEERAQSLGLFETLKTSPETLHEHMVKYVYPSIEGRDHQRLLYYFTLLENCGCSEFVKHAVKPETHIRLLKKFKAVAPGLNYKNLIDENENPLGTLEPVLTSQNILSISKLAPKIPKKDGGMLLPSSLYAVWLQKLFWNGDNHLIKKIPETMDEWLHAYDVCSKYFDRLDPDDIITFIDEITFSSKAVTKLTVETRIEVTKKAIKAVKHLSEKSRKKPSENDMEDAENPSVAYEKTLNHLQQSLAHLETLTHSFITYLKNSKQDVLQKYGYLYDLSRSEREKIHDQAVTMCIDGQPLDMIQQLIQVAVGDLGLSPKDIVQCAIKKIICTLRANDSSSTSVKDPLGILEGIVSAVHASVEKGEKVVSSDDLLEWLRPFCGDDSLPVKPRIRVLQILEQAFHLSDEDSKLLVYFRTQAVLRACWLETKVEITDIENEEKRYKLFLGLLESSHSLSEFQHLVLLLQAWPPMEMSNRLCTDGNPWVKLGTAMLQRCPAEEKESTGNEILKICRSLYDTKHMLPAECIKELCLLLLNQSLLLPSLKLLVESKDQDLHAVALEQITTVAKVDDSNCDAELLSLLLNAKLVVKCISTAFYPHLIDHLLANQEEGGWDVEEVAKQLKEAGFSAEAGSLLMSHRGTHPALRTFTTALQAIQHWI